MKSNNQVHVTIYMDREEWKKFRHGCYMYGCNMSKLFEGVVKQKLAEWKTRQQEVQRCLGHEQSDKNM